MVLLPVLQARGKGSQDHYSNDFSLNSSEIETCGKQTTSDITWYACNITTKTQHQQRQNDNDIGRREDWFQ